MCTDLIPSIIWPPQELMVADVKSPEHCWHWLANLWHHRTWPPLCPQILILNHRSWLLSITGGALKAPEQFSTKKRKKRGLASSKAYFAFVPPFELSLAFCPVGIFILGYLLHLSFELSLFQSPLSFPLGTFHLLSSGCPFLALQLHLMPVLPSVATRMPPLHCFAYFSHATSCFHSDHTGSVHLNLSNRVPYLWTITSYTIVESLLI